MADPVPIADHVTEALERDPDWLRERPRFEALLRSWTEPVNQLESAGWALYFGRGIDNAVGAQLDGLGDILHRPRNEANDTRYRIVLKAQIFALFVAIGCPDDYLRLINLLETDPPPVELLDHSYPAESVLVLGDETETPSDLLWEMLNLVRDLGVRLVMDYPTVDPDDTFSFSSDDSWEDSDAGFAESEDAETGGTFQWCVADSDKGLDQ
jgi:hypothetical protein